VSRIIETGEPPVKISAAFVVGSFIALLPPLPAQAAVQPGAGIYRAILYIATATPTATCAAIGEPAGSSNSGIFYYPGPLETGAVIRFPNGTATQILAQRFPKTPAAGATSWQGTSTEGYEPSGTLATIPFKATIKYLDSQSFTAVFSATVTVNASTKCSITENIIFIKSGS
jgi:hypothetical protein